MGGVCLQTPALSQKTSLEIELQWGLRALSPPLAGVAVGRYRAHSTFSMIPFTCDTQEISQATLEIMLWWGFGVWLRAAVVHRSGRSAGAGI